MRAEPGGTDAATDWVVGRVDAGGFIAVPPVAVDVVRLLGQGLTIGQVRQRILAERGRDIDVASFVAGLVEVGFVRAVDGETLPGEPPPPATLPWLRPRHVSWLPRWPTAVAAAATITAALVAVVARPDLLPGYRDLLWTGPTSIVLAVNAAIAWSIIGLHELAHLATARADGVPGRMGFGTRLQFLAAQTDVSGMWASPRRRRMVVYLSGIIVNLLVAAAAVLARAAAGAGSPAGRVCAAIVMVSLLFIPPQFLLFMRTDLYFVLQDATGCRNLYGDGSAYLRWLGSRAWHAARRRGRPAGNPLGGLRRREHAAIRWYAATLAIGTSICLLVAVTVTLPFTVSIITRSAAGLSPHAGAGRAADAVVSLALCGAYWTVWSRAWWRRHGPRLTAWLHAARPATRRHQRPSSLSTDNARR